MAGQTRISEDDFLRTVVEYAQWHKWLVHHAKPAVKHDRWATWQDGDPGFPDLVLARDERVIFAELKREKGKPTKAQMEWIEALGQPPAYVWYPSMWDTIERILR